MLNVKLYLTSMIICDAEPDPGMSTSCLSSEVGYHSLRSTKQWVQTGLWTCQTLK